MLARAYQYKTALDESPGTSSSRLKQGLWVGVPLIRGPRFEGPVHEDYDMVVSQNRGTQYRPQSTIILNIGTPKRYP